MLGGVIDYLKTMLPLLVIILLATLLLTRILSASITSPLYALLNGMTQVKKNKKYGLRLPIIREDEVGELTCRFNDMLAEIERRDQELTAHRDDLSDAVDKRTSELQYAMKNALASADVAKKAMSAKSDFLARVSHEIRTPINGVLGLSELLHDTKLTQKQLGYVEAINNSTKHLLTIVNDILDHAKIESGNFQVDIRPCYIKRIVESSVATMRGRAFEKNLKIKTDIAHAALEPMMGDPDRIEQIINNLVSNAIKFSGDGEIKISVQQDTEQKDHMIFSIIDHGIGIEEDKQQLIFDSFIQADGSTSRQYGGTGLGLTICKDLVGIMGGEIGVTSKKDQGSTFYFNIPMAKVVSGKELDVHESSDESNEFEYMRVSFSERPKILLVEDNMVNVLVGKGILQALECDVSSAYNGKEALDVCRKESFDLILMDCHMPIMNGFDAASAIKNDSLCADVPIVALTADVSEGIIERCRKVGMREYISKPYKKATISQMLKKLLIERKQVTEEVLEASLILEGAETELGPQPMIDRGVLEDIKSIGEPNGGDFLQEIITAYLEGSESMLNTIVTAAKQGDKDTLKSSAHTLKSSSHNVGANRLAELSFELEQTAHDNDDEKNSALVEQISITHQSVAESLNNEIQQQGSEQ